MKADPGEDPAPPRPPVLANHLRALRAFRAVATCGSTVAAARAVHLSQPVVVRAVATLEAACGVSLFDRAARGMVPTQGGARLAARAETVFLHLTAGASEALAAAPADARHRSRPERFSAAASPAQLRALVAISVQGTEAMAASALGVTQPAVHHALHGLEDALGVRLFYRLSSGTRLTPAGEALLRRVKLAMSELQAMQRDLALRRGEVQGRIVVGVLPLSVSIFVPQAVESLLHRHPDIAVEIVDGTYESLVRQLLNADIDTIAGALRPAPASAELQHHPLFDDDLVVVARVDHPCFRRASLRIADLLAWEWVVPLPGTPAERALDQVFRAHGSDPPRKGLRASSPATTSALVIQGGRLALASRGDAMLDLRAGHVRIVPVRLPGTRRRIGLVTRGTGQLSHDLHLFVEACRAATLPSAPADDGQA